MPSRDGGSAITEYRIYRSTIKGKEDLFDSVTASNTLYRDTSVTNGQTYYYKVSAVNEENEEGTFASTQATPTSSVTTPSAPQNLQASAGDGYVVLSWAVPSNNGGSAIVEYKIYRGTSSGGKRFLDFVSATTYRDTEVTNGLTYYYHVTAGNVAGESSPSDEESAKPQAPPGSPRKVKAAAGDSYVTLVWIAPSDGGSPITNYNIYRGTTSGGETLLETISNVSSYVDDDVINDQTFYYQVSAVNSAGEGEMSEEKFATLIPGVTVPSAPQNLKAIPGDDYVKLEWMPPRDDGGSTITSYNIYRGTAQGGELFVTGVGNVLSYTDDAVINDQRYYYQVSAENSRGEGEISNEVEVGPKSDPIDMGVWITIIVALIGAIGVIGAALINYFASKKTK